MSQVKKERITSQWLLSARLGTAALSALLFGCASTIQKQPAFSGGSKSDGIVSFSVIYKPKWEKPEYNLLRTESDASKACANWGYNSAKLIPAPKTTCLFRNNFDYCMEREIEYQFQCIN